MLHRRATLSKADIMNKKENQSRGKTVSESKKGGKKNFVNEKGTVVNLNNLGRGLSSCLQKRD